MSNKDFNDHKAYLGDAVYAAWDGLHIVLTAENGRHVIERICLDPSVWINLQRYHERLQTLIEQQGTAPPGTPTT